MFGDTKEEMKPDSFSAFLSYTRSVAQTSNTCTSYNEFMKYCEVHDEQVHSIFSMVLLRKKRHKGKPGLSQSQQSRPGRQESQFTKADKLCTHARGD